MTALEKKELKEAIREIIREPIQEKPQIKTRPDQIDAYISHDFERYKHVFKTLA